ncbi:tetratricopeptide repeat protein [bacterium]|nr:tetratricopeptide repeat protein [bacterium]
MGIHWGRLLVVLSTVGLIVGGGAVGYFTLYKSSNESAALVESVTKLLEAKDYPAADIEVEKLLRAKGHAGQPHLLKAMVLLEGQSLTDLAPTDLRSISAVRQLLQGVTKDPKLHEASLLLVSYFLNAGDVHSASQHARRVLETNPTDIVCEYAVAASLVPTRSQEAITYLDHLIAHEKPLRPRTVWILAQAGDMVRDRNDLAKSADDWLTQNESANFTEISDRLAMVELRIRRSQGSKDPATIEKQVNASIEELRSLSGQLATRHLSPRLILQTATRLIPDSASRSSELAATYSNLEPSINTFLDEVFETAAQAKVLDPTLYVGQARRWRAMGKVDQAVKLLEESIKMADAEGKETRQLFADADLWLAEHFLDDGKGELAEPHIQVLLANPAVLPIGQMLEGYRLLQQGKFTPASELLSQSLQKLPEVGAAQALYGLCQLRRGMISEGRQHLEQGIRLGASSPRYKAWLALALAEGGYREQAVAVTRELMEAGGTTLVGRALMGQLRLQAGDFASAAKDLDEALSVADDDSRPVIQLARAKLLLTEGKNDEALEVLKELRSTNMADQAIAIEYRHLVRQKQGREADELLAQGRQAHADSALLLAVDVQRLMELERFDDAENILLEVKEKDPKAIAPIVLLADVYEQAGQGEKAAAVLEKARADLPEDASIKIRLVEKLLTARSFERAHQLLEEMGKDPNINATTVDCLSARSAALQGDMKAAQEFVERAAAKDPDNPTLKFLMGHLAAQKGDYSAATELFEQSLASGNNRQQAVQALFESLLRQGDTSRAVEVLSNAQKQGQEVRDLRVQLLRLLARQENWGMLDAEVTEILKGNPTEADYLLVVSAFRYVRQPKMAGKYLSKGLTSFPESEALREQEASLLVELGDYAAAKERLDKLVVSQPSNAMIHVLRIYLLEKTKADAAAKTAIEDAWQKCPGHPAVLALYVQMLLKQGHVEQATTFAEKAKRDYPSLPDPRYLIARMHESIGNMDKAMSLLSVMIAEDPKNPKIAENYFRLLVQTGLPRDVEPTIEKLMSAQPNNQTLVGALAEYKALQGDLSMAERTIEKLEASKATGAMVDYTKAVLAFAKRDFKRADELAQVAAADAKSYIPATFLMARIRAAEGRFAEAIDLVGRVCRQQPGNPTSFLFLARLYGETGEWAKTEAVCREYLKEQSSDRSMRLLLARALLARGGDARAKEAGKIAWSVFEEGIRGGEELETVMNVLFAAGQSDRCRQIISQFESQGSAPENLLAIGRASFIAGDYATSARLADQVLVAQPRDVHALMLAADTETRLGANSDDATHFEKAAAIYEKLLAIDKTSTAAANNLAWTLGVLLGKEQRGLETILRYVPAASEPSPIVPVDVLDTVGTLHLRMNRMDVARQYFEALTQRDPDNATAWFRMGQIHDRTGRADRAEQCFAKARQLAPTENWQVRKTEAGLGN